MVSDFLGHFFCFIWLTKGDRFFSKMFEINIKKSMKDSKSFGLMFYNMLKVRNDVNPFKPFIDFRKWIFFILTLEFQN